MNLNKILKTGSRVLFSVAGCAIGLTAAQIVVESINDIIDETIKEPEKVNPDSED
jgi:hypothetical protein